MRPIATGAVLCALATAPLGCGESEEPPAERPRILLRGEETPRAAATRYLRRVRNSVWPLALAEYHPRVRSEFGLRRLAENLVFLRDTIVGVDTEVVAGTRRGRRGFATVRARPGPSAEFPTERRRFDFRMVLRDGRWVIAHDELTSLSVLRQFEVFAQNEIDPGEPPSRAARRRGRAVRAEFDAIGHRVFGEERRG